MAEPGNLAVKIALAAVSAALEGYDLTIYALFSVAIAHVFFPATDPTTSLLLAVGSLGVGYVMRPLGGIILGLYADRRGRKAAIVLTVTTMAISTGAIGLIPSFAAIGIIAPIAVVCTRLVLGFCAGGATACSISYLAEMAPPHRRGFFSSWQQASQIGAFLIASAIGALIAGLLPSDQVEQWGWRIPFLLALVSGPIGLALKARLSDPAIFEASKSAEQQNIALGAAVSVNLGAIAIGFGLTCLWNITAFILLLYMPTYAQRQLGLSPSDAFVSSTLAAALLFALCPLCGLVSDRIGRKRLMLGGAGALFVMIYPALAYVSAHRQFGALIAMQLALALPIAAYTAPVPALLAELFPTRTRSTGLAIAYNLSTVIIGAFGPLIVTWLIAVTHNPIAPAYYVCAGAAVSMTALIAVRDRTGQRL